MATKKRSTTKTAVGLGAAALAAAAAGAGYYFYGDKNAKKHRQAASTWAKGMKAEVLKEAKRVKKLDQKAMAKIVDRAAALYQGVRSVDKKDLRAAAAELKRNWRELEREIGGRVKAVKKVAKKKAPAKKTAKKAARRPAKKAAKKTTKRAR